MVNFQVAQMISSSRTSINNACGGVRGSLKEDGQLDPDFHI